MEDSSGDSPADRNGDRPVRGRPYLDQTSAGVPSGGGARSHDARAVARHGYRQAFPSQPRPDAMHGQLEQRAPYPNPRHRTLARQARDAPETGDTTELPRTSSAQAATAEAAYRHGNQQDWPSDRPEQQSRHARHGGWSLAGGDGRGLRVLTWLALAVAGAFTGYLLLAGIGLVGLPFGPRSLSDVPGSSSGDPPGSPGPEEFVGSPTPESTEASVSPSYSSTGGPVLITSSAEPTAGSPSTTTVPTPSATSSPTPNNHKPSTPPGQTRKPTTPPPP